MSDGMNKVMLIGFVGKEPEFREKSGHEITSLSLATTKTFKDRTSGEKKKNTEWHNVVLFGRQASLASNLIRKGSKVFVEGEIKYSKYIDKNGVERTGTQIQAYQFLLLDSKPSNNSENRGNSVNYADPKPLYTPNGNTLDDDVPF